MPFKSEKQRRWMHTNKPKMAKEWEQETSTKKNQWQLKNRVTNHGKTNHSEQGAVRVRR